MSAFRKRTPAQRAAIDKRAAAYPHPLSSPQVSALKAICASGLRKSNAGWSVPGSGGLNRFSTPTVVSLVKRGFARHYQKDHLIGTTAGRREAARHRRRQAA